jgi:CarD family transcriptional regulator
MATKTAERTMAKSAKPKNNKTNARRAKTVKARARPAPVKSKAKPPAKTAKAKKAPAKKIVPPKAEKKSPPKTLMKAEPLKKGPVAKAPQKVAAAKPAKAPLHAPKESGKKSAVAKAGPKDLAAKKKPEIPLKKKKLMVGQKPRSPKASESANYILPSYVKASPSVNEVPVKASPASAEAKLDFKVNDSIVYPAHGVGRIVAIEKQIIAGITNELFLIDFEQEKMKLRVPTAKAKAVGMRALSEPAQIKKAVETLKGRARIKRTMWSRRAQEYEAKINSGDIIAVAEVVRDLFRASDQPEQSYSERQLFEAALDRLAREVAAVNRTDLAAAIAVLEAALHQKKAA